MVIRFIVEPSINKNLSKLLSNLSVFVLIEVLATLKNISQSAERKALERGRKRVREREGGGEERERGKEREREREREGKKERGRERQRERGIERETQP